MHTVFINTSRNAVGGRIDVLGMEKEFKRITLVDCPLSQWLSKERGFEACALKIGEMIDSYKEINNHYNLIVYVDLLEMQEYADAFCGGVDLLTQNATYEVLRSIITRFFAATIYEKLDALGRHPSEKMLLLLEQNGRREEKYGKETLAANEAEMISVMDAEKIRVLLKLLGMPDRESMEALVRRASAEQLEETLRKELFEKPACLKAMDIRKLYQDKLQLLCDSIAKDGDSVSRACFDLYRAVETAYTSDCNNRVVISEYITDRRSGYTNKEIETKRNLLIQCFLLDCINSESIYDLENGIHSAKRVPSMTREQWEMVVQMLSRKRKAYENEELETSKLKESFTDLGLAPELYKLPHQKFGLDESGNPSTELVVKAKHAKKKQKDGKKKEELPVNGDQAELAEENGRIINWFHPDEYTLFDTTETGLEEEPKGLLAAEEYCGKAMALANHHLSFLNRLNLHVNRVVSNYAGNSLSNATAVLRKRSVCVDSSPTETSKNDYKYTAGAKVDETAPVESVLKTAKRSYITILMAYLKFNADRGVAVTTIKDQSQWFINRIRQIEESLNQLFSMLLVLAAALCVGYLPFVLIQWDAITENAGTVLIALVSLLVPFVFLGIGYVIAKILQKRKMGEEWRKLINKSKTAISDNVAAAKAYDSLLTMYIPALRWVYEYVLDVDFFSDCCRIAGAKLSHHKEKLRECREMTEKILEDLECGDCKPKGGAAGYDIDYTRSYCEGKNREIYSVIDQKILNIIGKERGASDQ